MFNCCETRVQEVLCKWHLVDSGTNNNARVSCLIRVEWVPWKELIQKTTVLGNLRRSPTSPRNCQCKGRPAFWKKLWIFKNLIFGSIWERLTSLWLNGILKKSIHDQQTKEHSAPLPTPLGSCFFGQSLSLPCLWKYFYVSLPSWFVGQKAVVR